MTSFRELIAAFRKLDIDRSRPVIAHASLKAFGPAFDKGHGGVETLLGAVLACYNTLVMPTFTYRTMLIPEDGPANNGLLYGSGKDQNLMAEFFHPDLPADRLMGIMPETLRRHPKAARSSHPILSFAGVNAGPILEAQTISKPLAPIRVLTEMEGWVLLLGVDYTVNTSVHYAEMLAGRKQFVRWALTPDGVVECPGFPGCSDGFRPLVGLLDGEARTTQVGNAVITAVPLPRLVEVVQAAIRADPLALLCNRFYCERCEATRKTMAVPSE